MHGPCKRETSKNNDGKSKTKKNYKKHISNNQCGLFNNKINPFKHISPLEINNLNYNNYVIELSKNFYNFNLIDINNIFV